MGDPVPKVFVSATSADLCSSRQSAKEALLTLGCHPVEQTNFPPDYRTVRDMLRKKILDCDAVIHVAGQSFGAEPKLSDPGTRRRSYTQLEYDIALELKKPIYVFLCNEGFDYDTHDPEDAERQQLQQQHRTALTKGDRYSPVSARLDLEKRVGQMQPVVDALKEEIERLAQEQQVTEQRHRDELRQDRDELRHIYSQMRSQLAAAQKRDASGSELIAEYQGRLASSSFSAVKTDTADRVAMILAEIT